MLMMVLGLAVGYEVPVALSEVCATIDGNALQQTNRLLRLLSELGVPRIILWRGSFCGLPLATDDPGAVSSMWLGPS